MAAEIPKDILDEVQRWTAKHRLTLVQTTLKGETSVVDGARKRGLTVVVQERRSRLLAGAETSLR